jgi:uroporphyrin-III C-methyltransferase
MTNTASQRRSLLHSNSQEHGAVAIVGAGPGDPELLTQRALRRLQHADIVFYDALVHPEVLALASQATLVSVGKTGGGASTPQRTIHTVMRDAARSGLRVVRLKGGDPFLFGRGGEEIAYLRNEGIPVELVPGISSALAAPAAAGIPVTHRGVSTHVSIVTAVGANDAAGLEPTWVALARTGGTVVFLMGLARLERIVAALLEGGIPSDRPAAVIASGCTDAQRAVYATLGTLSAATRETSVRAPALIVVGDVAALATTLLPDLHAAAPSPTLTA